MRLQDVLKEAVVLSSDASGMEEILGIAYSSKDVRPGALFTALKGEKSDGMDFVFEAEAGGAAVVLSEWPRPQSLSVPWVRVADARETMALAAANLYGRPSLKLKVIGVTGTKGKTTTTYILEEILKAAGSTPAVIGTIDYRGPGFRVKAARTTPEAPDLQRMLSEMVEAGASHCLMEVSSHALEQKRVWGVSFDVAVFTNLSGEHMDYHRSMENYFEAKKKLFLMNHKRVASVVNMDDPWGKKLVSELPMRTITYGLEPASIVRAERSKLSEKGIEVQVSYPGGQMLLTSGLVGRHNLYNILASAATALALNIQPGDIARGISALQGVPGRFEAVENGLGVRIVVDYAHTDNALSHLLETVRDLKPRRIILVFGAGGNRDTEKRERMGNVAARLADWSVLTSDNPRSEDPLRIIAGIEKGFGKNGAKNYEIVADRKEAIRKALSLSRKGDYVLVAGKGHEDYQILNDKTIPFNDIEVIKALVEEMGRT
jgi:UDP-N-acetylmuramoyl-L-alanyl-D-glutamate--2,6-diaminopimelate ligase